MKLARFWVKCMFFKASGKEVSKKKQTNKQNPNRNRRFIERQTDKLADVIFISFFFRGGSKDGADSWGVFPLQNKKNKKTVKEMGDEINGLSTTLSDLSTNFFQVTALG